MNSQPPGLFQGAREDPLCSPAGPFAPADSRSRLLGGVVAVVAERGYNTATVGQIAAAAGVQRPLFYRYFTDKEHCFLAAYDLAVEWLAATLAPTIEAAEDWPRGVATVVDATLALLSTRPALAAFCGIEAPFVGPVALARHQATMERLAASLRGGRAHCAWGDQLPSTLERTVISGAIWLISHRARQGGGDALPGLRSGLIYFLTVPYLGIAAGQRLVGGESPSPPRVGSAG